MAAAGNLDWLYHLLGYSLAAAGALLLLWALFWDRSRGRRRCPKCWYDMRGVPGPKCPECGREAAKEAALTRTRRHPRRAAIAVVLGIAGYTAAVVPRFRDHGWVGLVPMTYLALAAPPETPDPWAGRPTSAAPTTHALLNAEAWRRVEEGSTWLWQSQVFIERVMSAERIDPRRFLRVPETWPMCVPVPCIVSADVGNLTLSVISVPGSTKVSPLSATWKAVPQSTWMLPALEVPSTSIGAVIEFRAPRPGGFAGVGPVVYRTRQFAPIEARVPFADFMTRVDSPEAAAAVREVLCPYLAERNGRLELILFNRSDTDERIVLPFLVGFICEVRFGDRVLRCKRDVAPHGPFEKLMWSASRIDCSGEDIDRIRAGQATITVRGDYEGAMNVYTSNPFQPPVRECWTGEFTVPLTIMADPRTK
jgi:hypothetical protein